MSSMTANDLKTRGIAAIEAALADRKEAVVTVRGTDRCVVMHLSHDHYLRECELEAALAQSRLELAESRCLEESATAHVARVQTLNATAPARRAAPMKAPKRAAR